MSDIEAQPETTQFGPFLLDRRRRLLLSGGKPVKIGTMQFDLLAYLIDHRDQAPTRDDITAHVWRGLAVGTNSLSVQLSALRKVLAENGGDERLIITLPGQRYRFVGEVVGEDCETAPAANAPAQTDPSPPLPSSPRRRGLEIGAGFVLTIIIIVSAVWSLRLIPFSATVPAVPLLSIVVLPFRNLSDNKSDDHLADAVTDDLTVKLARTPGSFVIARETANAYLARGTSPKDIGAALRVRYLIDGTVDPEESTLRITVKLIDTSTGAYVWAKTLGVARDRISEVRDLIVGRIMSSLDLELVEAESTRSLRDRPDNPGAIDLFFQARSILDRGDLLPDYNAAQDLLEKAIKLQPDFGDALAELGWMLVCKLADDADPQEETDAAEAKSMVTRALKLSRDNPRALAAGARLLALAGDYPGAVSNARAALSIEPSSADADLALANAEFYQACVSTRKDRRANCASCAWATSN
jgi:TolB-like protein/DNA-binding winged helix-turn-helix (wHTH) protein